MCTHETLSPSLWARVLHQTFGGSSWKERAGGGCWAPLCPGGEGCDWRRGGHLQAESTLQFQASESLHRVLWHGAELFMYGWSPQAHFVWVFHTSQRSKKRQIADPWVLCCSVSSNKLCLKSTGWVMFSEELMCPTVIYHISTVFIHIHRGKWIPSCMSCMLALSTKGLSTRRNISVLQLCYTSSLKYLFQLM